MKWKRASGERGYLSRRSHLRFLVLNWMRMDIEKVYRIIGRQCHLWHPGNVCRKVTFNSCLFLHIGNVVADMAEFQGINLVAQLRMIPEWRRRELMDEMWREMFFKGFDPR